MDCDCHPHQTAHTDQRSQLKNMTIVLSMDCCFCESSCNFRFSEASSTSSSSFSRSFLSPHPSALFQPFLFWAVGKMDPYFWKLFVVALCLCSCQQQQKEELSSSSSAHETADAETQFIPFSVRWMDGGQRLCSVDVWVTPTLPGTVQAWQRQIHRCYLCLFFCVRAHEQRRWQQGRCAAFAGSWTAAVVSMSGPSPRRQTTDSPQFGFTGLSSYVSGYLQSSLGWRMQVLHLIWNWAAQIKWSPVRTTL